MDFDVYHGIHWRNCFVACRQEVDLGACAEVLRHRDQETWIEADRDLQVAEYDH